MSLIARSVQKYQVEMFAGQHRLMADEPVAVGGDDTAPNPYELLMGALASCKIITVQMYAERKGWSLDGVEVRTRTSKIHAEDCQTCESDPGARIDLIEVAIHFDGDLDDTQIARLKEISERCPVHRTLTSETVIRTTLAREL